MGKAQATVLATALTGVVVYVLAQAFDLTLDQAIASHITTILSTLIALFMPPPSGGVAALRVSPRTQPGEPVAQTQVFEEEITE